MKTHSENTNKNCRNSSSVAKRFFIGLLLIGGGLVWLGANLGYIPAIVKEYVISWQALVIAVGLVNLVSSRANLWFSLVLIFVGSLFMFAKYNELPVDAHLIVWPVVLIFIGLAVLTKIGHSHNWKKRLNKANVGNDYLDDTNIFGGSKINVSSKSFKGGQSTCIFGGSEINFAHAELQDGDTEYEVNCVFGGVKLIVPADWDVVTEVTGVLGGMSDKRQIVTDKHVDYSKRLIIKGNCVFGGAELESVVRR
jgi:predicted membrane protein